MPHKMNARTSERIHGFKVILAGHLAMAAGLAGEQWNEGDVSCSVVRRVMLPDAFYAIDGLFQSLLTVLAESGFYPAVIANELDANLPFLSTTRILMAAVKEGMGREQAHEVVKSHAVAAALSRRQGIEDDLVERLGSDDEFPLDEMAIRELIAGPLSFAGRAEEQVGEFVERVERLAARYPEAAGYQGVEIL